MLSLKVIRICLENYELLLDTEDNIFLVIYKVQFLFSIITKFPN
jgi:hypothetical protein